MKYFILLFGILYGIARGMGEGQVMFFPNVREHPLFDLYHYIRLFEPACLIAATIAWGISDATKKLIAGALFLMWEAFEISYIFSRMGQVSLGHENLLGVLSIDSVILILFIHAARILIGCGLVYFGRK